MKYSIFDHGNLVATYDEQTEAEDALDRLAAEDPAARLHMVTFLSVGEFEPTPTRWLERP